MNSKPSIVPVKSNVDRSIVNSTFEIFFFFEKSNKINFNKMRQNFQKKKEIFKNEIFVDKNVLKCIINCLALLVNARTMCIH